MRTRRLTSPSDPMPSGHRTVLLQESIDALDIQVNDTVLDATLGGAGHAQEIARRLGVGGTLVGFDADEDAISRAKLVLANATAKTHLVHGNFRYVRRELEKIGITRIHKALFDLGWSGYQLNSDRGFSFQSGENLSMAYDKDQALTAEVIVNEWKEESLADVIFGWGEERYARRIAKAIVDARETRPIKTSRQLAEIVRSAVPAAARYGRIHPATKTFQALRIAVNDELGALSEALRNTWSVLEEEGRIAVISFHSLEDRIVKHLFADLVRRGQGQLIFKKPIIATAAEIQINPRSRSAKLRVIKKVHGEA